MSYFLFGGRKIYFAAAGTGEPLLLLHGNTASGKMFGPVVPLFAEKHTVYTLDFPGCGLSDSMDIWPLDLWYTWGEAAAGLCRHENLSGVNVIGASGGALAALNLALEHPELVHKAVADSFEGLRADPALTEQITAGRALAKENPGFCAMLREMHGDDWEQVFDADTRAVTGHAREVGAFLHRSLSALERDVLFTGSAEDEMFPAGHYDRLFAGICGETRRASQHIFSRGRHPAAVSVGAEFAALCEAFFQD